MYQSMIPRSALYLISRFTSVSVLCGCQHDRRAQGSELRGNVRTAQAGARGAEGHAEDYGDVEVRDDDHARRREGDE